MLLIIRPGIALGSRLAVACILSRFPRLKYSSQVSVDMTKPGGTGSLNRNISHRLLPFPPSRSVMEASPSLNAYTSFLSPGFPVTIYYLLTDCSLRVWEGGRTPRRLDDSGGQSPIIAHPCERKSSGCTRVWKTKYHGSAKISIDQEEQT